MILPDSVLTLTRASERPASTRNAFAGFAASPYRRRITGSTVLAALLATWAVLALLTPHVRLVVHSPEFSSDGSLAAAELRLFAAVVLFLFPAGVERLRLRWVALAFALLGTTTFLYEYLQPVLSGYRDINASIYTLMAARILAAGLLWIGLASDKPAPLTREAILIILAVSLAIIYGVQLLSPHAPHLAPTASWVNIESHGSASLFHMTRWNWIIGLIPVVMLLGAISAEIRHPPRSLSRNWLLPALIVLEGAYVHEMLWPSSYGPFFTSAKALAIAFSIVIAIGSIVDLRQIAIERKFLLDAEIRASQQLAQLAALKADFTAMVAHELASPVGAIRNFSALLTMENIAPEERQEAIGAISSESKVLSALVQDVQAAGEVERTDFSVYLRPHSLSSLLAGVARFGNAQPGHHPTTVTIDREYQVLADDNRLGQVLHNLVSNAGKYSPPGTPINVRATRSLDRVQVEVIDRGYGIRSEDMSRILEKFGRGRDAAGSQIPGAGLGLYVARRILLAHGTDLAIRSTPGHGSTFSFELELIP